MNAAGSNATFGTRRKFTIAVNVVVMTVLAIAAGGIAVYLTGFTTFKKRFDLTRAGNYTLTPETERLLDSLEQDVEVITVFDRASTANVWWDTEQVRAKAMDYVADLLQEYKVRGAGKVTVTHLDPATQTDAIFTLFQQLGIRTYNVVIVRGTGGQRRVLALETDLVDLDFGSQDPFRPMRLIAYRVEEALSGAIYDVTQGRQPKVYVTTSHGELSLDDASNHGLKAAGTVLTQDNVLILPLSLNVAKAVPGDADAVFIIGATEPFLDAERAALENYLRSGRARLVVGQDPFGDKSLDELWRSLGVELERNVICHDQDGTLQAVASSEVVVGKDAPGTYGVHPITQYLQQNGVYLRLSRSGGLSATSGAEGAFTTLIASHQDAWGDVPSRKGEPGNFKFDGIEERKGQRTLAAAIEPKGAYSGAKIVFLASDRWACNAFLDSGMNPEARGHYEFLRRTVSWLVGRKKSIELPPRRATQTYSDLRPDEYDDIMLYIVVYMPLGALALTILVWFARRR